MKKIFDFCREELCLSSEEMAFGKGILLLNGDCRKLLPRISGEFPEFAAASINDPPYGTTDISWDKIIPAARYWKLLEDALQERAPMIAFGSMPFSAFLVASNPQWFRYALVWDKNKCGSPGLAKYRPMKTHEDILVFGKKSPNYYPIMEEGEAYVRVTHRDPSKKKLNTHGMFRGGVGVRVQENEGFRYPKSVRRVSRDFSAQQQLHPTQKPVELMQWLVETYTKRGDIVLDMTCGVGPTAVACLNAKRRALCIEKRPVYFHIARSWLRSMIRNERWHPADFRRQLYEAGQLP